MEQDKWITTVLNSTNGITKVAPDEMLFLKIQHKINTKKTISINWAWAVAASFAVLLTLNFIIIFSESKKSKSKTEMIAFSMSKNNQLY